MAASATRPTHEHASDSNPRRFMSNELRNFLTLSYDELEQLNLNAKEQRKNRVPVHKVQEERLKYLTDEKRIKAVTVLFSDLEGDRKSTRLNSSHSQISYAVFCLKKKTT